MTTVYRVQDRAGRGPWKPGFSHVWAEDRDDHALLVPWYQQFGWVNKCAIAGMNVGCACRTLDQLRRWFTPSEYVTLQGLGYRAVQIEVGRILGESDIQLVFERARPLREAATPVDLYPATIARAACK